MTSDKNDWTPLTGGSVNTVARKDNVVRRELSAASPAVHQVLRWLEFQHLEQIPHLLGTDETYEYLHFIPGETLTRPWRVAIKTDSWLTQIGEWLRRYHTAIAGFRLQGDARFAWGPGAAEPDMIVCHGDLGPWNCVERGGELAAVIDWDLAHYGYRLDDVAEFALESVPLRPILKNTMGEDTSRVVLEQRLATFCSAYGVQPGDVLRHLPRYLSKVIAQVQEAADQGDEPFVSFMQRGTVEELERDKAFVESVWLR